MVVHEPPLWETHLTDMLERLAPRLREGADTYGDASFEGGIAETLDEVEEELLDVVGWMVPTWAKLQRLRAALARLEQKAKAS